MVFSPRSTVIHGRWNNTISVVLYSYNEERLLWQDDLRTKIYNIATCKTLVNKILQLVCKKLLRQPACEGFLVILKCLLKVNFNI